MYLISIFQKGRRPHSNRLSVVLLGRFDDPVSPFKRYESTDAHAAERAEGQSQKEHDEHHVLPQNGLGHLALGSYSSVPQLHEDREQKI